MSRRNSAMTPGRLIALVMAVFGLAHASTPWWLGYSHLPQATAANAAGGLAVAALALVRAVAGGGPFRWTLLGAGLVGAWMLAAPLVLDFGQHPWAAAQSLLGGGLTLVFSGVAGLSRAVTTAQDAERQPG